MILSEYTKDDQSGDGVELWARGRSVRTPAFLKVDSSVSNLMLTVEGGGVRRSENYPAFAGFVPLPRAYPAVFGGVGREGNRSVVTVEVNGKAFEGTAGFPSTTTAGGYPWPFVWEDCLSYFSGSLLNGAETLLRNLPTVPSCDVTLSWFTASGERMALPAVRVASNITLSGNEVAEGNEVGGFAYAKSATLSYATLPVPEECADSLATMFATPYVFVALDPTCVIVNNVNLKKTGHCLYAEVEVLTQLYHNTL